MKARKEYVQQPTLHMEVFHDEIYNGRELMKVVGIRVGQVELEGDYSGGTNPSKETSWYSTYGSFRLRKVCKEAEKPKGCQLHNLHCGFPDCEPYLTNYGHYIDGKLVDEVEVLK